MCSKGRESLINFAYKRGGVMRIICIIMLGLLLSAGPSFAGELNIGLIPEQNVFKQMERYEPIGRYVESKTGIKVNFIILSRYGNIIDSFVKRNMDGAFWGSFTGAMAIKQVGVEPLVRPVWFDGTSTYHGYIFVRKDSGIKNFADMRGRTIAFVEKATTAGYIFPKAYFKEQGIEALDKFFKEYYFAGSHDAAVKAVLDGEADIGCAKNTIFNIMADREPRVKEDLTVLARSPNVPSNALAVKGDLDGNVKKKLRDALLGMENDPEGMATLRRFGAMRFIKTSREDYKPVFDLAEKAGIELKGYRYKNE
jgi:phosphonate transport system substrate-binding protein